MDGEINHQSILEFYSDFYQGKLKDYYKSEEIKD
jgi:hypothetical protein